MRKRIGFFLLACICLSPLPVFAASPTLRVVTINVWSGLDYKGIVKLGSFESGEARRQRYRILVEQLRELDPHVVGVNEANRLPRYARNLARDLNMDAVYFVGLGGIRIGSLGIPVNLREGDAILAKRELNLQSLGRKRLAGRGIVNNLVAFHFDEIRQVIGGSIDFAGRKVFLFCTHVHASPPNEAWFVERLEGAHRNGRLTARNLKTATRLLGERQRRRDREIRKLLSWVSKTAPKTAPVILMGDFNAEAGADEMRQIPRARLIDTFRTKNPGDPGLTWNYETNRSLHAYASTRTKDWLRPAGALEILSDVMSKRIDFIFAGGSIAAADIAGSRVVLDREIGGLHCSDHFGVMSEIRIR